jgi:hypothetical protein
VPAKRAQTEPRRPKFPISRGTVFRGGSEARNSSYNWLRKSGQVKVNADCTGTYTVTGGGLTIDAFFVIAQAGNELQIVITDPGTVINCVARKQFPEHHE